MKYFVTLLTVLICGCAHLPVEPVEPPQAKEACNAFCELRVTLKCDVTPDSPGADEIDGTVDDESCEDTCRDIVTQGQYDPVRACLDDVDTCEDTEECIFGAAEAPEMGS